MSGWRLQDLDLRGRDDVLARLDASGALLLGCRLDADVEQDLLEGGALVSRACRTCRSTPIARALHPRRAERRTGRRGYDATTDAAVYAWSRQQGHDLRASLAETLHDLSVDDALEDLVHGRPVVGMRGGHALSRGTSGYRDAARLGRSVTRGAQAANLGAYLARVEDEAVEEADAMLAGVVAAAPCSRRGSGDAVVGPPRGRPGRGRGAAWRR